MSTYNQQQSEALLLVRRHLAALPPSAVEALRDEIGPYLEFRARVARFHREHLAGACARRCFDHGRSDCCGREGILTFFADVVVNVLLSPDEEVARLLETIAGDPGGESCVYLAASGCLWRLKPIVCEMFLCEQVLAAALGDDPALRGRWERLRTEEHRFTRPTVPVLFDDLERRFREAGLDSPLMYCHHSPGLLRLKKRHGVGAAGGAPSRGDAAPA
jgi:hypothetical protein